MKPPARHSLVRRLIGGAVFVVLLAFALQALVLTWWLKPLVQQFFGGAADGARQAQAALRATPEADRAALARALSVGKVTLHPSDFSCDEFPLALMGRYPPDFQAQVDQLAAQGISMMMRPGDGEGDAVAFCFTVGRDAWGLEWQVDRPTPAVAGTLTLWLLLIAGATAVALLWSVRSISRPLADLAQQMGAQHGRLKPLQEASFSSHELHAVARAFNELVHQAAYQAQVKHQLLAGVSHDLRTPLARLRLRVEIQCPDELAGQLTADLLAMEHSVDQFLAYVQGDIDTPQGRPRPLVDCVKDVVAPYQAAGQPVQLELAPLHQPVPHLAVRRLLANLIDNALAHGQAPVRVVLLEAAPALELQVWDQGPGMTPEEFTRAQQPFVRLEGTRTDGGHCGLGLAIATQMARQLGGSLQVVRHPVRGFGIVLRMPHPGLGATPGHMA